MDTSSLSHPLDLGQPSFRTRDDGKTPDRDARSFRREASEDDTDGSILKLPSKLVPGERILWQGAPRWQTVALHVFHTRLILIYFAAFAVWQTGSVYTGGGSALQALFAGAFAAALAVPAVGILAGIAWLVQRTTVYTITTHRVLFSIGITLPKTFNIPFSKIESASLRSNADGTGNLSLKLAPGKKIGVALLWPHARPWRLRDPEPTFRGVANVAQVAHLLSDAVRAADAAGSPTIENAPAPQPSEQNPASVGTGAPRPAAPPTPLPIKLAGMMVVLCLAVVVIARLGDVAPVGDAAATPALVHELRFVPMDDGRTSVHTAGAEAPLGIIEPTDDGLIRGALRGFTRGRRLAKLPIDAPYQLIRWDNGSITLTDPLTSESVPLDAFGPIGGGTMLTLMQLAAEPSTETSQVQVK